MMITRGIVLDVKDNNTKVKVRIPTIHGMEGAPLCIADEKIQTWASVMCVPGTQVNYKQGDVVIVGFEDFSYDKPIVLGYLASPIGKYVCAKLNGEDTHQGYDTVQKVEMFPKVVAQDILVEGTLKVNQLDATSPAGININSTVTVTQGVSKVTVDLVKMQADLDKLQTTINSLSGIVGGLMPPTPPTEPEEPQT